MGSVPGPECDTATASATLATSVSAPASPLCLNVLPKTLTKGMFDPASPFYVPTANIWLCKPFTGTANSGNTPCGTHVLTERIQMADDIDTCNDDDDADGSPCAGDPTHAPQSWQWVNPGVPSAPHSDYCLNLASDYMPGQTAVDCGRTNAGASVTWPGGYMSDTSQTFTAANIGQLLCAATTPSPLTNARPCAPVTSLSCGGSCLVAAIPAQTAGTRYLLADQANTIANTGEKSEGLGAIEFQLKFDDKIFQSPTADCLGDTSNTDIGADTVLDDTNRVVQTTVSIITENWIMIGCVTKNPGGQNPTITNGPSVKDSPAIAVRVNLVVQPDLFSRMRPAKDNGVSTNLLDENCEAADTLGQPYNQGIGLHGENASPSGGLTQFCTDASATVRMLEGDINNDCVVDVADDQSEAFRYGQFFGQLNYNRFYDLEPNISPDFDIDIKDLQTVFGRNGSTCIKPIPDQPPLNPIPDP
jgi:hypothetical protein